MPRPRKNAEDQNPTQEATPTATAQAEAAPRVSVINRRLQNPFGTPSRDIPLKGDKAHGWVTRTFAADPEHPNRHYDAVHRLGWIPLTRADLAVSPESIGFTVTPDGRIVRGPNGAEVLMAMPKTDFDAVQRAKSDENLRKLDKKYTRSEVAQATAKEHGSEAGDTVYKHFEQQETVETITVGGNG